MKNTYWFTEVPSPLGEIILVATVRGLCGVYFLNQKGLPDDRTDWIRDPLRFQGVKSWLSGYFSGQKPSFDGPFDLRGTEFQQRIWDALRKIPYGSTLTYQNVATEIGQPNAARAVGAAIGRNRVSLIIPCHRVVGRDGRLTGYAGGLERKESLLRFEQTANWR